MRKPLTAAFLLLAALSIWSNAAAAGDELFYVGTYTGKGSEGIYGYRCDPATGEIRPLGLVARTENPSFLVADPNGRYLYAVNELDTFQGRAAGAMTAFAIDPGSGALTSLQQVSSLGGGPAHLSLDRTARFLLVANYGGGSVAAYSLGSDGRIGPATAFMQARGSSIDPKRQAGPHAHCVQMTADNRRALVADLGIDRLLVYDFDARTGALAADSLRHYRATPGSGPRHIAVASAGNRVYVVNEMASTVSVLAYAGTTGTLEHQQTLSTIPSGSTGSNTTAEVLLDGDGRHLYLTNRGDDSIVMYGVDPVSGLLTELQRISSGGKSPRHIALDLTGRWLLAANARSNLITIFRVDHGTGRLSETARSIQVVTPVCVVFAPAR